MAVNPKIVIDSNILISSLIFGGKQKELISKILEKRLRVYTSYELISETLGVLRIKFHFSQEKIRRLEKSILGMSEVVYPTKEISIARDPDDNRVLEVAGEAGCDFIVSGDKDLLLLTKYGKCRIVNSSEFLRIIERDFLSVQ